MAILLGNISFLLIVQERKKEPHLKLDGGENKSEVSWTLWRLLAGAEGTRGASSSCTAAISAISAGEQWATGSWAGEAVAFKWSLPLLRDTKHHQPDGSSCYTFRQHQEIHPPKKRQSKTFYLGVTKFVATDISATINSKRKKFSTRLVDVKSGDFATSREKLL